MDIGGDGLKGPSSEGRGVGGGVSATPGICWRPPGGDEGHESDDDSLLTLSRYLAARLPLCR